MNTRIEIRDQPEVSGNILYLKGCSSGQQSCTSDLLTVKWDTYLVNYSFDKDTTCDFSSLSLNQQSGECERCDHCVDQPQCSLMFSEDPSFGGGFGPSVFRFEGFVTDAAAPTLVSDLPYNSGCPNANPGNEITPTGIAMYQVQAAKFSSENAGCEQRKILAEKRVFVVSDTASLATYPLQPHHDSVLPHVFFKGGFGTDADWDAGFSSHLRITKIRILQGVLMRDPRANLFKLDEATIKKVHPSRIVLFAGFQDLNSVKDNDRTRCYADNSEDGNIDLLRHCLHDSPYGNMNVAHQDHFANPIFLENVFTDTLTWFVEFNPAEGGVAPSLDPNNPNEVLAIEFTIEPA